MSSPKRTSLPRSELTTADIYSQLHGIPEDVQLRLQNVGRLKRQSVAMNGTNAPLSNRTFMPTQSLPAFGSSSPFFMSERDTYAAAQSIISKEELRRKEIQPYAGGSSVDALDLASRAEAARLRVEADAAADARGTKRQATDEIVSAAGDEETDEFPQVFTDSHISQPELFASALMPPPPVPLRTTRMLPARGFGDRGGFNKTISAPVLGTFSGMDIDPTTGNAGFSNWPRAAAGPAAVAAGAIVGGFAPSPVPASPLGGPVSAPFTAGFGGFSPVPSFNAAPPKEEAEEEEDGFDVSEWATSEQF